MTLITPAAPRTQLDRLRWAVADALIITRRDVDHWARRPGALAVGMLFPVLTMLMFGYLFGGGMSVPGGGDYREFLVPGMLALTMVFGIEVTVAAVTADAARGVTDRFRSLPMAPSAVVAGRSIADMLSSTVGLAVLIACGTVVGLRWNRGIGAALLAVALLLLLRFAILWVGIYVGLVAKGPEALAAMQMLVWPLSFLSNAIAPTETMPSWLGAIAAWNPLSATVSATRELFGSPGWGGDSWIAQHAVLMAVVWPVLLAALFIPLSVRRYRWLSR